MSVKRNCGHPIGTTRWCPDCDLADRKNYVSLPRGAAPEQPMTFRKEHERAMLDLHPDSVKQFQIPRELLADPMADRDPLDYFYRKCEGYTSARPPHGDGKTTIVREVPIIEPAVARDIARMLLRSGPQGSIVNVSASGYSVNNPMTVPPGKVQVDFELLVGLLALACTMPLKHEVTHG